MKLYNWFIAVLLLGIFILLFLSNLQREKLISFTDWVQTNYNAPYEENNP
jgi:hypothetical protein